MTVRTRDYEGRRELDPQCAPDEVDTVFECQCQSCGEEWVQDYNGSACPGCGESDPDWIVCIEVTP